MNDSAAQQPSSTPQQTPPPSYVDQYLPPAEQSAQLSEGNEMQALPPAQAAPNTPDTAPAPTPASTPATPATPPQVSPTSPAAAPSTSTPSPSAANAKTSEALEDQNIFDLLGISQATDEEKEGFLDELQQVIWEDFVEKDVELLLTEDELKEFRAIAEKVTEDEEERQGQMIDFLEKLIPDLEKIMLEKALDLKEEMTRERIKEYLEMYASDAAKLEEVKRAEKMIDDQKWKSGADVLNAMIS